ncbi:polar amino acid transport system substrate-binding protein [Chromobacterium alkanivorans]|uniref:substrate-binding periplasmic protein n=1 Tax=Chromobacterium alkanivorans TaxID=1071719 RepID=UPI0019681A74|nr:transporter substrate-binding domain-containing protein [Chromobacterium alkanivorans]MBN3006549.1 transporter substrate-binding domain-containing protein [Chromobacterium alkanivorans]MCS3804448.1 polar amino acid transport system substrate-binding protein [Chromobacterium alkanivorans]MCS3818787.1 polar amino acid transport system substrate-binding protein [Chromobacterium alkanivorans]MCS3873355.1 polar amino acid transport system substrate-binding protein [Chromobacterium alkanivorans]
MPRVRLIFLLLSLCAPVVAAEPRPAALRLCTEDMDSPPWRSQNGPSLSLLMLKAAAQKTNIKLEIREMAWIRCLSEVQNNQIDGVFEISFKPDRLRIGVYPMKGDAPDPAMRMHLDGYSLYRLKGSKLEWDGQSLSHLDGAVGAQTGFSVIAQLQALGAPVDDSSRNPEQNLNKLLARRIGALALPTLTGDSLLASNPLYKDRIEKVGPDLVAKPYYLIFSRRFADGHPKLTRQLWEAIAQTRESPDYRKALQDALRQLNR